MEAFSTATIPHFPTLQDWIVSRLAALTQSLVHDVDVVCFEPMRTAELSLTFAEGRLADLHFIQ